MRYVLAGRALSSSSRSIRKSAGYRGYLRRLLLTRARTFTFRWFVPPSARSTAHSSIPIGGVLKLAGTGPSERGPARLGGVRSVSPIGSSYTVVVRQRGFA